MKIAFAKTTVINVNVYTKTTVININFICNFMNNSYSRLLREDIFHKI